MQVYNPGPGMRVHSSPSDTDELRSRPPAAVQPRAGAGVSEVGDAPELWPGPHPAPHPGRALQSLELWWHRYARPVSESFPPEASTEKQSLSRSPLLPPRWLQWAGGDGMGTARFEGPGTLMMVLDPWLAIESSIHLPQPLSESHTRLSAFLFSLDRDLPRHRLTLNAGSSCLHPQSAGTTGVCTPSLVCLFIYFCFM